SHRLKVLFFSQPFVYPADTGGKIRTSQTLRHLRDVFDITLVSNVDPKTDLPHLHQMDPLCHHFHPVPRSTVTKYSLAFYLKVLAYSLSRYPVTVLVDYSQHTVAKLSELLTTRAFPPPRPLLFQHNVESMIWERYYRTCQRPLLRLFWYLQWRKVQRY